MMPDAIEPTTPNASTICFWFRPSALPTAAAAPIAPNTAVGWKPALCTIFGATRPSRHMISMPTAMPSSAALPPRRYRSPIASTAGTITAPACTGPPSNVSSKSSPCAAVPLPKAAPAALKCTFMADGGAGSVFVPARQRAADIVLVSRGDAEPDDIDQRFLAFRSRGGRELSGVDRHDPLGELFGNGNVGKFCVHRQIPSTMNTGPVIPTRQENAQTSWGRTG